MEVVKESDEFKASKEGVQDYGSLNRRKYERSNSLRVPASGNRSNEAVLPDVLLSDRVSYTSSRRKSLEADADLFPHTDTSSSHKLSRLHSMIQLSIDPKAIDTLSSSHPSKRDDPDPEFEEQASVDESSDDEAEYFEHRSSLQGFKDLMYGVLFFMVHGNKTELYIEYKTLLFEDLQLFSFFVSAEVNSVYALPDWLANLANFNIQTQPLNGMALWIILTAILSGL
ncbi:hypothetical protein HDU76_012846 [Blyttiomyces sp. JEL0837]|nr:hypothetical protein HDU76_012846 [Blyttiomyces sp. JEL0837]